MFEVEYAVIPEASAVGSVGIQQEWAEDGSDESADAEGGDAHAAGKENAAKDDAEVVDERRDGLEGELFADQKDGGKDASSEEKELRGEQDAGDARAEDANGRGGIEVDASEGGSIDFGEEDSSAEDDSHRVENDGEGTLAFGFVVGGAIAVEDGDEGDGGGSADEEVIEQLGEDEGDVVGVGVVACAELVGDVLVADEADD